MPNTIADNLQALNTARLNIADAITNKGGTVNTDKRFSLFPNDINSIPTANLTTLNVTENGTYYESTPTEITSTSFPITLNNCLGTNLIDYLISGNMSQSGTPSPDSSIQPSECGERTKNLFDKDNVVFSGFYPHADTGAVVNTTSGKLLSIIVPCEPNTSYTWSFDRIVADLRNRVAGYSAYPTVGMACTFLDRETDSPSGSTRTVQKFTTTANTHWLILMVTGTGQTAETLTEDVAENAQLEIGTEMTSYEPYGYKIPISVNGQTNNIYLGEVETTRYVKQLVLTGEENWIYDSNGSRCYINITDAYAKDNRRTQCYCSHYICVYNGEPFNTIPNHSIYINLYNAVARFYIKNEEFTSAADFKSFLAQQYANGTPVTIWYVLANPKTTVVNEPIRKIGDYADTLSYEQAGVQIPTNKGNTVIDVETTLKPSEMYIKYDQPSEYAGYNIVNVNVPIPTKYVTEITITENIIEDNIFKNYTALETAILLNTLTTIGIGSFENCTSLTLTTLPDTVTTINNNAFNNCASLSLTALPTSLITIGNNAFSGTAMAGEIHIPNTVTTIGDNIFSNTGITDIIFDGTPTTISSNAFSNINSLETIYVPWAEGTVTGAPWGAGSNVTILYVNTN